MGHWVIQPTLLSPDVNLPTHLLSVMSSQGLDHAFHSRYASTLATLTFQSDGEHTVYVDIQRDNTPLADDEV